MASTPKPDPKTDPKTGEGSFLSHLIELRNRLLYSLIGIGVVFAPLAYFSNDLYLLLAQPLMDILPKEQGAGMIATGLVSTFIVPIKLAFFAAVVVTVPFWLYQLWAFVAPGLYLHERRLVLPLLTSSTVLFYVGMAFAYFVVFPMVFGFFVKTVPAGVLMMTDIKAYMDFVLGMFLAFGLAFEVPVATVLLIRLGMMSPEKLSAQRPYIVLGIFIVAAFLTPPDALSQILLAVPMWVLFEVGLFVGYRVRTKSVASSSVDPDAA